MRAAALFLLAASAWAAPSLPSAFTDHMVVQRGKPVPVWGWADAGESIAVRLGPAKARTTAGADGRWRVDLGALPSAGPYTMVVEGKTMLYVRDVAVGEVWVASGQSNMDFPMFRATTAAEDLPTATDPGLRLLRVPRSTALEPQERFTGAWQISGPESARTFSAVAWYFARELRRKLNVPVGIIEDAWSGSIADEWTDPASLAKDPDFAPILDRWHKAEPQASGAVEKPYAFDLEFDGVSNCSYNWDAAPQTYFDAGSPMHVWGKLFSNDTAQVRVEAAPETLRYRGKGKFRAGRQVLEAGPDWQELKLAAGGPLVIAPGPGGEVVRIPSGLYHAMLRPIVPYGMRGVLWYQGEGNSGRAMQYRKLLPAMIAGWRKDWDAGDFPFLLVQLPNYRARRAEPSQSSWAEQRESQLVISRTVPHAGIVVTIDLGEADDVHPRNKKPVGERAARWALGGIYGQAGEYSGPLYDSMASDGSRLRVRFTHAEGLRALDGGALRGFAVAGADRKFVWAQAVVDGDAVVVSNPEVAAPVSVRYAWADNPDCNLGNGAGLPASPFRTDDWPGVTFNSR